jgi:hypothetical protein
MKKIEYKNKYHWCSYCGDSTKDNWNTRELHDEYEEFGSYLASTKGYDTVKCPKCINRKSSSGKFNFNEVAV